MRAIDEALAWASSIQLFAPISPHHRRAVAELWDTLAPLGIKTALEVGTGEPPGLVVEMLREHGVKAYGLDGQRGSDYQGDMHDLPFPADTFDLVVARHSLEHVLIPYVALREMKRVSKKWVLAILPQISKKTLEWPDHLHLYGREGWELIFHKVGLKVEHFEIGDHTEEFAQQGHLWTDLEWRYLLRKEE